MEKILQNIRSEGHSRVMAVTKLLPRDWQSVHCEVVKVAKEIVTLRFTKVR